MAEPTKPADAKASAPKTIMAHVLDEMESDKASRISYAGDKSDENPRGHYEANPGEDVILTMVDFERFRAKGLVRAIG